MRKVVVLPAPFGPSRPKISPRPDLEADVVHRGEGAEAPHQILHLDLAAAVARGPRAAGAAARRSRQARRAARRVWRSSVMKPSSKCAGVGVTGVGRDAGERRRGVWRCSARPARARPPAPRPRPPDRQQPRLQFARLLVGRGVAAGSCGPRPRALTLCGRALRQHMAVVQDDDVVAAVGLVEIGGADDDRQAGARAPGRG